MTNEQGFIMIGKRADALAKDSSVQKKNDGNTGQGRKRSGNKISIFARNFHSLRSITTPPTRRGCVG